jgi:hypothetical protein
MSLSITELQRLEANGQGEEIDRQVEAWLKRPVDFTTAEGKQEGHKRAQTITALRLCDLWPASERARGGKTT